jgi:glycosyltransferase involved in cell wall biosynthesis
VKIAIYAGMFKKDQDGATKTLYELTNFLIESGIEVGIWAFSITPQKRDKLTLFTIPSFPLPFYPDYRISVPNLKLRSQIRNFNPDVIHISVPDLIGVSMMRIAKKEGIPVLTSYHTDFPSYLKSYKLEFLYKYVWKFFKWFYNRGKIVLVPTRIVKSQLLANGIKDVSLWVRGIHNDAYNPGFRTESLRKKWGAGGKKVILFVGRFVWYKNLKTFIRIYQKFELEKNNKVKFVLAGDGPIRGVLEQKMPNAVFTGYVTGETLSRVYASSDIFLFPSTTETFGNVILEAFASGIPVVVSDVGGCRELVEESGAGLIANADDENHFFQACRNILNDDFLYKSMKERGILYAASKNWDMVNSNVIKHYRVLTLTNTKKGKVGIPLLATD